MKKLLFAFTMMFAFAAPKFFTGENENDGGSTTKNTPTEEKQEEVPYKEQKPPAEQKEEVAPASEGDEQG